MHGRGEGGSGNLTRMLQKSQRNQQEYHTENKITEDTRYNLPRLKIKDTAPAGHFFSRNDMTDTARTHARPNRNDFPVQGGVLARTLSPQPPIFQKFENF